jgi:hypothetical protein
MKTIPETRGRRQSNFYKFTSKPKKYDVSKRHSISAYARRKGIAIKTAIVDGQLWVSLNR